MIHVVRDRASSIELHDMLEALQTYVKVAVDVRRQVLAGGGEMHADCEAVLLEDGSAQEDIWGADWFPENQTVRCQSLINIRPSQGNTSLLITDARRRETVERIVRERLRTQ